MGLLESEICGIMKYVSKEKKNGLSIAMMGKQKVLCTGNYFGTMVKSFNWKCDVEILNKLEKSDEIDSYDMFRALGFSRIDAIDYSDYEGANLIFDLNKPVPSTMFEQYDYVIDGGTTEHIFDVALAIDNMIRMLKVGGYIFHIVPCDGWVDHGFYSLSPTFFRDYYPLNGFVIESLELEIVCDENKDGVQSFLCGDMRLLGGPSRMNKFIKRRMHGGDKALIFCVAKKMEHVELIKKPIQGMWNKTYEVD